MTLKFVREELKKWFLPGVFLVGSVTLLAFGVPRLLHELMLVPGTPILERINSGESVSDEEFNLLERSRMDALGYAELPKAYADLGASYLMRALQAIQKGDQLKYANMAIQAYKKSIDMEPLNTFSWLRVSTAYTLLGPDNYNMALQAWRISIATAPFEPFVLLQRIHIGTILYQNMTLDDIKLLNDQLKKAYNWDRQQLKSYAQQNNLTDWFLALSGPTSEMSKYLLE